MNFVVVIVTGRGYRFGFEYHLRRSMLYWGVSSSI